MDSDEDRRKKKRKRRASSSSSSSSSSDSSPERKKRKAKKEAKRQKRKEKKKLKKMEKKKKREERKHKKLSRKEITPEPKPEISASTKEKPKKEKSTTVVDERSLAMRPMTPAEWEARQSVIRRVVDPETGRSRLIKGDGEILEEIVSRKQHLAINKQATQGDGQSFQSRLGLLKK